MGRLGLAFKVLFNAQVADKLRQVMADADEVPTPAIEARPTPAAPARSEALTLLAAFQREARLVDFLKEPIDGYSDAQVGAAVRDIHRGCHEVVERMFGPMPVVDQPEGSQVQISGAGSEKYRLTGHVAAASGNISGQLMHHGWQASRCEVPRWTGAEDAANVIGPAEIQV